MTDMRVEKELLDKEMTVVRNEFEMGENNPSRMLQQRTLRPPIRFTTTANCPSARVRTSSMFQSTISTPSIISTTSPITRS